MSKIDFSNIPEQYQANVNQISNEVIKKLYSNFDFLYFPFKIHIEEEVKNDTNKNTNYQNKICSLFLEYLTNFKLITYHILNINKSNKNKSDEVIVNLIICVESRCIIVEEINIELVNQIINNLKEKQIHIINYTNKSSNSSSLEEQRANEEVNNFLSKFKQDINKNGFVKMTIQSIVGFLIRRYFYPSSFFKDPSFFDYKKSNESILSQKFDNFLFSNKERDNSKNLPKLSLMMNLIRSNKENYEKQDFKEKDFIILRTLFSNDKFVFYFVIHIKSFYVFMMKKMIYPSDDSKEKNHEITFCENYSHRCLTRLYGFLKEKEKIVGFIYEFMPNGSLNSFVSSTKDNLSNDFLLMTIYRILQGLDYLHSNSLIHRDIKPSNILLNHDFIPYISDFETVRQISKDEEKLDSNFTTNIGSIFYSSPEQYQGKAVSFSTDVFSFGLIVYFLFEKKNLISDYSFFDDLNNFDKNLPSLQTNSEIFQSIFKKCVKYSPNERMNLHEIKQAIFNNSFKFDYLEQFLLKNENFLENQRILTQFLYEVCLNMNNDVGLIMKMLLYILNFHYLFMIKKEDGNSEFLLSLGNLFINGQGIEQNYLKAMKYFELAANLGNSNAFLNLGILYSNGLGVDQNFTKAINYFELASQKNNSEAILNLGIFYYNGNGVEKDYLKARNYFELAAKLGNSNAYLNLGLLYSDGLGVKQDYLKAKEYYEKAAQFNNSDAIFNLGNLYFYGRGVEQSYSKAKELYELSAKFGNSIAIYNIGELYFYGNGVDKDYFKAKHFYELAAQYENDDALYSLGYLYKKGLGTQKDYSKAKENFELAADQENSKAILNLGILYVNGEGVEKNYLKAKEYFEMASKLNNSDGFVNIGTLFLNGFGVEKNYAKAKEYYELAAKQNNSTALVILGNIYADGLGVVKNYEKAKEYYELAAKQNNSKAFLNLGYLYYYGFGVVKDYLKAKDYYEKSAKQGNLAAILNLGYLYENGNGVEIDYLQSKKYFELLAEKNDSYGLYELGELYFFGEGIEKDYKKAKEYFQLSANQNNSDALVKLGEIYFYGFGVESDYLKSIDYFELAAKHNDPRSLFYLGLIYSTGDDFYLNIPKAIEYFTRCSEIHSKQFQFFNPRENSFSIRFNFNEYLYRSSNDLGLIYLLILNDVGKASEFLEKAAFAEYSYAQNNFGLFNQFFLNNIEKAKYMYTRSSEHKFALAYFNLGLLAEKENDLKKSIEYFIKASDNQDEPLIFQKYKHYDKRLEISKAFIICLTNLKLVDFYLKQSKNDEAKKYFIKAFQNLQINESYKFEFKFINNRFSYLKTFIIDYPPFNLKNQPNLNLKCSQIHSNQKKDSESSNNLSDFDIKFSQNQDQNQNESNEKQDVYKETGDLFDFVISKNELKNYFLEDLKEIIETMNEILFTPPYLILFGRISFVKPKSEQKVKLNPEQKSLNNSFYEGFEGEINSSFFTDENK